MIWLIIGLLLTFAVGVVLNYVGAALVVEAFACSGGDAIGTFLGGVLIVLCGCAAYILHGVMWNVAVKEIKECLKE